MGECVVCKNSEVLTNDNTGERLEYCSKKCRKVAVKEGFLEACDNCGVFPKLLHDGKSLDYCSDCNSELKKKPKDDDLTDEGVLSKDDELTDEEDFKTYYHTDFEEHYTDFKGAEQEHSPPKNYYTDYKPAEQEYSAPKYYHNNFNDFNVEQEDSPPKYESHEKYTERCITSTSEKNIPPAVSATGLAVEPIQKIIVVEQPPPPLPPRPPPPPPPQPQSQSQPIVFYDPNTGKTYCYAIDPNLSVQNGQLQQLKPLPQLQQLQPLPEQLPEQQQQQRPPQSQPQSQSQAKLKSQKAMIVKLAKEATKSAIVKQLAKDAAGYVVNTVVDAIKK